MRDLALTDDAAARSCTINAVRNFGVLQQMQGGDVEGAQAVTDQILASCADG